MTAHQRRILALVALGAVPFGFAAHTAREGGRAIVASDQAAARGDLDGAIAEARRAATDDVPLFGHQDEGYDRLETMARAAEQRHDEDRALKAWAGEHSAALASSGLRKHAARLQTSSGALAHLYKVRSEEANAATSTGGNSNAGNAPNANAPVDEAKLAADLATDETPIPRPAILALTVAAVLAAVAAFVSQARKRAARSESTAQNG